MGEQDRGALPGGRRTVRGDGDGSVRGQRRDLGAFVPAAGTLAAGLGHVGRGLLVDQPHLDALLLGELVGQPQSQVVGEDKLATEVVDGHALGHRDLICPGLGHRETRDDTGDVEQPTLAALTVEVIALLVDEVLILQELSVEEADAFLYHIGLGVVRHGDSFR